MPGSEWLFEKVVVNHTFLDLNGSNELVLSDTFDGLLLLAEISVARY